MFDKRQRLWFFQKNDNTRGRGGGDYFKMRWTTLDFSKKRRGEIKKGKLGHFIVSY